jgi:alpha-galactosidase
MNKFYTTLLALLIAVVPTNAQTISEGVWNIVFDSSNKTFDVQNNGNTIITQAYARAKWVLDGSTDEQDMASTSASTMTVGSGELISDSLGSGTRYVVDYGWDDGTHMLQSFTFYPDYDYFVVQLGVTHAGYTVKSGWIEPICSETTTAFLPSDGSNRMLFVPWDNDGYVSYQSRTLSNHTVDSYAVTAVYDATSRLGFVAGAIDHDKWKSAIHVEGTDGYEVSNFGCISGYTDGFSRDTIASGESVTVVPHGKVVGDTVSSSRFIIGLFDDWRDGMEAFGEACAMVAPPRTWDGGRPVGWSSWGTMQTKISYQGVVDVGDFIKENLMPKGFYDKQNKVTLSLDAWWNDNLSDAQVSQFVAYCNENNMIPGLYYGPFCLFGDLNNTVPGTSGLYKFSDIALKVNGVYKKLDGAYCLDPTHPGTKMFMMNDIKKFSNWGIKYLKLDFMGQGAIEADSWHDSQVTTGVEAYNQGMQFLVNQIKRFNNGDENAIYLDLSMSPLFPYQYTHGRRTCCDSWNTIGHTKYVMNALSFGWWEQKLYVSLDPDHLVMHANDNNASESEGVNRARLTSGILTGAYLTGDNFSDNVDAGYPTESRERALEFLTNEDVNEMVRTLTAFRPVEGNYAGTNGAERIFQQENDNYWYVAILNYDSFGSYSGSVTFDRLGIDANNVGEIKELWSGSTVTPSDGGFSFNVPYSDAAIYRIAKLNSTGINAIEETESEDGLHATIDGDVLRVTTNTLMSSVALYDVAGQLVSLTPLNGNSCSILISQLDHGVYVVKGESHSGKVISTKVIL